MATQSTTRCLYVVPILVLMGCFGQTSRSGIDIVLGETLESTTQTLSLEATGDILGYLQSDPVFQSSANELYTIDNQGTKIELIGLSGEIIDLVPFDNTALCLTTVGLFVYEDTGFVRSPLDGELPSTAVALRAGGLGDDSSVFILTTQSVFAWRDGILRVLPLPDEVDVFNAQFAAQANRRYGVLWLYSQNKLFALIHDDDNFASFDAQQQPDVQDMGTDASGNLWVLDIQGRLFERQETGSWVFWRSPQVIRRLLTNPRSTTVYLEDDEGFILQRSHLFQRLATPALQGEIIAGPASQLLVRTGPELQVLRPRIELGIAASATDSELDSLRVIEVDIPFVESASELRATADGQNLPVSRTQGQVVVSPWHLGGGEKTVEISVSYDDGSPTLSKTLMFQVAASPELPYSVAVQPVFARDCDACHGARGSAHSMDSPSVWEEEIDEAISSMLEARMPLPPNTLVPLEDIALIEAWKLGGFSR